MPSSGYVADTFVAGEQPTTAKWNELWGNDAAFNSGAGFNDSVIVARHLAAGAVTAPAILNYNIPYQKDNSNTISNTTSNTNVLMQVGWGQVVGNNSTNVADTVTFPTSFTTVLGLVVTLGGVKTSPAAASITDLTLGYTTVAEVSWSNLTNAGFQLDMNRSTTTFATTAFYGYTWMAWGI